MKKKQKKIIPTYEAHEYESPRTGIKIIHLKKEKIFENLGMNLNNLQNIVKEQAKKLPFNDDVLQALAKAVNIRIFSLIRAANIKKEMRIKTNPNLTSIPKLNFILLNAEQNRDEKKEFPNEEPSDDETKQFVTSLIEGKKFRIQENTKKGLVSRKYPHNIRSLIPETQQSPFITPYDIFSALDDDKYMALDQKRYFYQLKYFDNSSSMKSTDSYIMSDEDMYY